MAERSDVYAYLWVANASPEDVSDQLGLAPTKVVYPGQIGEYGPPAKASRWEILSPLPRGSALLQDYLEALLDLLEPRATRLLSILDRYPGGINCVGYYYGGHPGLHLSADLLRRLAALRLPVDFDLYNYREEDGEA